MTGTSKRGGFQSHMFDQVMMLKNTAKEFNEDHRDHLQKIKTLHFHCPMGWIRAQMGVSQDVTSGDGE